MGFGVFDSDRAAVNDQATGIRKAKAGLFLLLFSIN